MADKDKNQPPASEEPKGQELAPKVTADLVAGRGDTPDGTPGRPINIAGRIALTRPELNFTDDKALWAAIRNRTDAIRGDRFEAFITKVLCLGDPTGAAVCTPEGNAPYAGTIDSLVAAKRTELIGVMSGYGIDAYNLLKYATQAFLLLEAGVVIRHPRVPLNDDENGQDDIAAGEAQRINESGDLTFAQLQERLENFLAGTLNTPRPYLTRIAETLVSDLKTDSPFCEHVLTHRFTCPSMLELIWSYWHEEGMLVQTMNAICMRFQNRRGPSPRDPLANLEIDPLRPLNNLLWGYIQDEYNRLTVPRRAYEYDHHYGLRLVGKAVPELRSADSRSKFIEAFHNLLHRTASFYREDADTTVIADGFSLLSSLREVHLLLAEGAHNQFGDLPWTSRAEMLMMQWILSRPEMREFLRGRAMVPYKEGWMGQVDTMKKLQGWTDTTITHFRDLAVYGEQILLSIRYGNWTEINDQDSAKTWARYWRPEIQGYIHAYLAATGVDLTEDIVDSRGAPVRYVQPSTLLRNRISANGSRGELSGAAVRRTLTAGGISFGAVSSRRRALNPARKD